MASAPDARVRLSFDVYNITHDSTAASNIDPRVVLEERVSELVKRVSVLVADEALDYAQLLNFTADFQSLVERNERAAHDHRHRESDSFTTCHRQARLTQVLQQTACSPKALGLAAASIPAFSAIIAVEQ